MIILLVMEVTSKKKSVFYYWENVLTVCGEFNFRCVATTTAIRITGAQSKLVLLAVFQRYDDAPVTVSFYFMHLYPDLGVNISPVEFEVLGYFPAVACFPGELCPHGTVDHVGEGLEFIGRAWRTLTGTFLLKQCLTEINLFFIKNWLQNHYTFCEGLMYAKNIYVLVGDYIEVIWAIETYLDRC